PPGGGVGGRGRGPARGPRPRPAPPSPPAAPGSSGSSNSPNTSASPTSPSLTGTSSVSSLTRTRDSDTIALLSSSGAPGPHAPAVRYQGSFFPGIALAAGGARHREVRHAGAAAPGSAEGPEHQLGERVVQAGHDDDHHEHEHQGDDRVRPQLPAGRQDDLAEFRHDLAQEERGSRPVLLGAGPVPLLRALTTQLSRHVLT